MKMRNVFFMACTALLCASAMTFGQTWVEVGDAPDGVPDRQDTVGVGPLININGFLDSDIDTYSIVITDVDAFYATTAPLGFNGTGFADFDSTMWLWDEFGNPVLGNDDSFGSLLSTITDPANFGVTGGAVNADAANIRLTPGKYLLSIGAFNDGPVDINGDRVILTSGAFSDLHGPNPLSNGIFNNWLGNGAVGAYSVELGGATFCAIPEPASSALLALGVIGLACVRKRKRA